MFRVVPFRATDDSVAPFPGTSSRGWRSCRPPEANDPFRQLPPPVDFPARLQRQEGLASIVAFHHCGYEVEVFHQMIHPFVVLLHAAVRQI